jgi:hypothetical protein
MYQCAARDRGLTDRSPHYHCVAAYIQAVGGEPIARTRDRDHAYGSHVFLIVSGASVVGFQQKHTGKRPAADVSGKPIKGTAVKKQR